jgi:APA family basic amino acid/polyamine antiporter
MPLANGGPYAYSRRGLGDFAGFLVAWGYLVSVCCANAAIAVSFYKRTQYFHSFIGNTSRIRNDITGLGIILAFQLAD